ncbi:invasion associated locus B family protein [Shimia sp. W99]|uniref:Invasion protein IalB, involved in pathogenesis n=1 Tax=Shimia aestuarii TaxID=254406 RepID=A0A1I4P0J8_9RHOB|nr:invasion associated locus B family protein [Shimia aestuarii]SFM21259.1 Invasion protein IalB, involved in pathogenesis [Shimia aestuarii]
MPKLKLLLGAAAISLLAAPVLAQGVGSLSDGSLAMGQKVEAAPAPSDAEDITVEQIGDWSLQCAKSGPEPRPCRMYQLLKDNAGNAVAEVTLYKLKTPAGEAIGGGTFVVPLETLLTGQLTVAVDGENAKRYPYAFCNPVGCFARIGLTQEDVDAFKSGSVAKIAIVPAAAPAQVVTVNMSLNGFTKTYDSANPVQE